MSLKRTKCLKPKLCLACAKEIPKGAYYVKFETFKGFIPSLGRPIIDSDAFHEECWMLSDVSKLKFRCSKCDQEVTGDFVTSHRKIVCQACHAGSVSAQKIHKSFCGDV